MNRLLLSCALSGLTALACATPRPEPTPPVFGYRELGRCTPATGSLGEAGRAESVQIASGILADAFASLGNEFPERHRQFIPRERVPLQRFPRITSPAIVDPTKGTHERGTDAWFFPFVVDEERFGELSPERIPGELSFWLVRHGVSPATASWFDVTECLVRDQADPTRVHTQKPDRRAVTFARDEVLRGMVFEIPTRVSDPDSQIAPDFYDLKPLPRLNSLSGLTLQTRGLSEVVAAVQAGDWLRALRVTDAVKAEELLDPGVATELRQIADRVGPHPSPHFARDLRTLRGHLTSLADVLGRRPAEDASVQEGQRWMWEVELGLSRIGQTIRALLDSEHTLAPVALADPEQSSCGDLGCVRFAVSGDVQYHGNIGPFLRFLGRFDPEILQGVSDDAALGNEEVHSDRPAPFDVDFVVLAGDMADAAASSAPSQLVANFFGILPPRSPYGEDGGNEMVELRAQLARFKKPFFAIPGNHDGYAGFGGLHSLLIDELGSLVTEVVRPWSELRAREWGAKVKALNSYLPMLVQWRLPARLPRYDGLGEWQNYFGPLNLAFKFRGHAFIGLNTVDLTRYERASAGAVVFAWGGGVQDESVDWLEAVVNRFAPEPGAAQFVFMHQDPRAAVPSKAKYREESFGIYDPTDSPISRYTLGIFGLGNSPRTGFYIPFVTPFVNYATRSWDIRVSGSGKWQEEWMRKSDWGWPQFDYSLYNARGLIEVINCNLAGRTAPTAPPQVERSSWLRPSWLQFSLPWRDDVEHCVERRGGISHLLFAHNDIPLRASWADPAQRRAIFREDPERPWRPVFSFSKKLGALVGLKFRNNGPPEWATQLRLDESHGNASVLRLDDVGQIQSYHGFHLITLYEDGRREIEWISLSR